MIRYTIEQGEHYSRPVRKRVMFRPTVLKGIIRFDKSWQYIISSTDQLDINKIFGVAFIPWWKAVLIPVLPASAVLLLNEHHNNSVRLGARYEPDSKLMETFLYAYVNKERISIPLTLCNFEDFYEFKFIFTKDNILLTVENLSTGVMKMVALKHPYQSSLMLSLNPYFGGNLTAPHRIITEIY